MISENVVEVNLQPEFVVPLQPIHFNATQVGLNSFTAGRLADYEGDDFSVSFPGVLQYEYINPSMDGEGNIIVVFDPSTPKKAQNGAFQIAIQVAQKDAKGVVSTQLYFLDVEISGIPE